MLDKLATEHKIVLVGRMAGTVVATVWLSCTPFPALMMMYCAN